METGRVSRREFFSVGLTALGGLAIGVRLAPGGRTGTAKAFAPNAFLRIEPSGEVFVIVPRPEMGQGSRTAIAMLVAEELEADWKRVRVEQADLDEERYGPQYAGGSAVVRTSWTPLRQAGAAARMMLVQAAASQWKVDAAQCVAEAGRVRHAPPQVRAGRCSFPCARIAHGSSRSAIIRAAAAPFPRHIRGLRRLRGSRRSPLACFSHRQPFPCPRASACIQAHVAAPFPIADPFPALPP